VPRAFRTTCAAPAAVGPPCAVTLDETGREAAARMALENLDRLPVLSDDGRRRLLGTLTRLDMVKALLAH